MISEMKFVRTVAFYRMTGNVGKQTIGEELIRPALYI
jgi:hypothetical protein